MNKIVIFSEDDIKTINNLLNGIGVVGVKNCKQIAFIAQILESGKIAESEVVDETEKEGEG